MDSLKTTLKAGDYVYCIPVKCAVLITPSYEDGNYLTCSLEAINKFPNSYRIATEEEIEISKNLKNRFIECCQLKDFEGKCD